MADTEGDLQTWRLSELGKAKKINLAKPLRSQMRKLRPRDQRDKRDNDRMVHSGTGAPMAHEDSALSIKLDNLQPSVKIWTQQV